MKFMFGVIKSEILAEAVLTELEIDGLTNQEISLLFLYKSGSRELNRMKKSMKRKRRQHPSRAPLGGALGLMGGVGCLSIPGTGVSLMAAGPVMTSLSHKPACGSVNELQFAMKEMGIPASLLGCYEEQLRAEGFLFAVAARSRLQEELVLKSFREAHAVCIHQKTAAKTAA